MKKEINITLKKTKDGYTIGDETNARVLYFNDEDSSRKELIGYIIDNVMNIEIEDGRKYK